MEPISLATSPVCFDGLQVIASRQLVAARENGRYRIESTGDTNDCVLVALSAYCAELIPGMTALFANYANAKGPAYDEFIGACLALFYQPSLDPDVSVLAKQLDALTQRNSNLLTLDGLLSTLEKVGWITRTKTGVYQSDHVRFPQDWLLATSPVRATASPNTASLILTKPRDFHLHALVDWNPYEVQRQAKVRDQSVLEILDICFNDQITRRIHEVIDWLAEYRLNNHLFGDVCTVEEVYSVMAKFHSPRTTVAQLFFDPNKKNKPFKVSPIPGDWHKGSADTVIVGCPGHWRLIAWQNGNHHHSFFVTDP
jgi:hypothetical protein